ncbi:SDR family NAD(P)-dependent oxidoreductase [Sphingopyxis sp.]|uniref:SDR family NAD(P)-dependent oxidoreductase n=1 Tax=Sphingopyxis sp. TaxID=1908224 RepID=UPI003D6CFF6A
MTLNGKVALITGGGQGVGRGIALALARQGADVALMGRTQETLDKVVPEIEAIGRRAFATTGNVRSAADLAQLVDRTVDALGGIDILVNNAQEVPLGALLEVEDEAFAGGFESGPLAAFRLMRLVQPVMKARGGGVIFNLVTSAGVRWNMAGYGTYGAIKQAMRNLTRAAAAEWGTDGIRVLSIAPLAMSPGMEGWIKGSPDEAAAYFQTIPLGRVGDCEEDIGRGVAALASDDLRYLTGATIPLDGGQANFD